MIINGTEARLSFHFCLKGEMKMDEQIIKNIENALNTWNEKLGEVMDIITTSPVDYRDGDLWNVVTDIFNVVQGIGIPLLILCVAIGIFGVTSTIAETRRPEVAVRLFIRAGVASGIVTSAQSILLKIMNICQEIAVDINSAVTFQITDVPLEVEQAVEDLSWYQSIGYFLVSFVGSLAVTVAALIVILTVYGRFFKIYLYIIISPIPLATFGSKTTEHIGMSFIKSFIGVGLEAVIIVAAISLYSAFVSAPVVNGTEPGTILWNYIIDVILNVLILVTIVKTAPTIVREMLGL